MSCLPRTRTALRGTLGAVLGAAAGIAFVVGFFLAFTGCAPAATATPPAQTPDRSAESLAAGLGRRTFDSAWTIIGKTHYDTALRGVDWNAVRADLGPRADSAATLGALRAVVGEMLGRLGESHFAVIPQETADAVDPGAGGDAAGGIGDAGLEVRWVEGDVVVSHVDPDGPAAAAGVRAGWVVDSIGRFGRGRMRATVARLATDAERRQAAMVLPLTVAARLAGVPGTRAEAVFRDARGRRVPVSLVRRPAPGEPVRFGNLPTMMSHVAHERRALPDGGCVGIVRFNVWMMPLVPRIQAAADSLAGCRGIVYDVRGNPGGVAGMIMALGGQLVDSATTLGTMRTRGGTLRMVALPRRVDMQGARVTPYAGRVAVLVDGLSMSTSEFFAGGLQAVKRARVFGEPSAGQALPAMMSRLPTGDVLLHATGDYVDGAGRRLEGAGVVPDERVPLTRAALLAGRDEALDAALRWIAAPADAAR